jgi:hypothetical protein
MKIFKKVLTGQMWIIALTVASFLFSGCGIREKELASGIIDETETVASGQVLDIDRKPVTGARVMLHGDSLGDSSMGGSMAVLTDKNGNYRFAGKFHAKAYLEVNWKDSLGLLDSVDFTVDKSIERPESVLKYKGNLILQTIDLDSGDVLWIPQLGTKMAISGDGKMISIKAPPGTLSIIVIRGKGQESISKPAVIHEAETTAIDLGKEQGVLPDTLVLKDSRDGRVYRIGTFGKQIWMTENLNYGVLDSSKSTLQTGAQKYCFHNDSLQCNNETHYELMY